MLEITPPDGWIVQGKQIERIFEFKDFAQAFAFMTRVAILAEELNHHPDWSNSYNKVTIILTSHDQGCLTDLDCTMAERINQIQRDR
ncbi:MAG TPA: 4a-hydroxytetrahydrobiopterin dehydratase [Alphaproteobacteria bacterium]